jgi:hypothetical protein
MPTDTFSVAASADDGFLTRDGTGEFPTTGTITLTTNTTSDFGLQTRIVLNTGISFSNVCVGALRFDTSSLGAGAVVSDAVLRWSVTAKQNDEAHALNLEWFDFGAALGTEDYVAAVGTTAAQVADATWSAWATTGTVDVTLSNVENVNTTGYTGLRVGMNGAPSDPSQTRINIAELDHTTRDEPKLLVTYTESADPSVLVVPPIRRVF